jgi:site-specific DNA-methyltransferase (adenine-specific)
MVTTNLIHGDCLEAMRGISDESIDLVIADPPYNIRKAEWDNIPDYLQWSELWIAAASRCLKRQGAFWCFHSRPLVLSSIANIIERYGRGLKNWIVWDKYNDSPLSVKYVMNRTKIGRPDGNNKRTFDSDAEHIVYHADEGDWTKQTDKNRGFIFEPLRAYLDGERKRAGVDKVACNVACGFSPSSGGMASRHYFSRSQWCFPTEEHYNLLQILFNAGRGNEYLTRSYDEFRREYEYLRPTFNNPGKVSSVWQFPPAISCGHPTTKPLGLMERIIETTTNEGDVVLDPFMGSGTSGVACKNLNRNFVGVEIDVGYFKVAEERIKNHAAG